MRTQDREKNTCKQEEEVEALTCEAVQSGGSQERD